MVSKSTAGKIVATELANVTNKYFTDKNIKVKVEVIINDKIECSLPGMKQQTKNESRPSKPPGKWLSNSEQLLKRQG